MSVLDDEINERWIIKDNKLKKWILNLFKIIFFNIHKSNCIFSSSFVKTSLKNVNNSWLKPELSNIFLMV